jgi:hypothetical protein
MTTPVAAPSTRVTTATLCSAVRAETVADKLAIAVGTVGACELTSGGGDHVLTGDLHRSNQYGLWTIGIAGTKGKADRYQRDAAGESAVSVAGRDCYTHQDLRPVPVASLVCNNPAQRDIVTLTLQPNHRPLPPAVMKNIRALADAVYPALFTYRTS